MHIKPKILYYGTPVVLLSTWNENDTSNLAPISSSWALGNVLVLGLGIDGKSLQNLQRHGEGVLNLPDASLWQAVEKLAPLTGLDPVPDDKAANRFRYEADKFGSCGLTPLASELVKPERVEECPLQIEARVRQIRIPEYEPSFAIVEVEAVYVHAHEGIVLDEHHVDPQSWNPLIYNFRHYFGLSPQLGKTFRAET